MYGRIYGWPMEKIIGMGTAVNPHITDLTTFVLFAIIPFNLVKHSLTCIIAAVLYKALRQIGVKGMVKEND